VYLVEFFSFVTWLMQLDNGDQSITAIQLELLDLDIVGDVGEAGSGVAHLTSVQFNPQRHTRVVLRMYCNVSRLHHHHHRYHRRRRRCRHHNLPGPDSV